MNSNRECTICNNNITNHYAFPCEHAICHKCLLKIHQKQSCWICKKEIQYIASLDNEVMTETTNIRNYTINIFFGFIVTFIFLVLIGTIIFMTIYIMRYVT
jgi:hypothetical protein